MKSSTRFRLLTLAASLGLTAVILMVVCLSTAAAAGEVDFTLEMEAPAHVAVSSTYVVKISIYNVGTVVAPTAQVTATLPEGTEFVTATDRWEEPFPPDVTDGNTLSWYLTGLTCHKPLDANCGHILLTLETDEDLPEGTMLTTTAQIATTAVESNTTNNQASVVSLIGQMAGSTKQVQARHVMPGDLLTYTITISRARHAGGSQRQWATLTDTLPTSHHVRFLGWQSALSGTLIEGHRLRWEGPVFAGEPLTLQYRLGVEGVVTPGTIITNAAMLGWDGQEMLLGPVTTVVTLPHGNLALGPFQGGQLYHQYGVSLTVPPGAISDTTRFQFRPLPTDTVPITPPGSLLFANRAFELNAWRFGEPVREFSRPLTITVHYTDTDVAGLKRETLRLWTRSGPTGPWTVLGEPARVMSRALAFTTTHFSEFALFGEGEVDLAVDVKMPAHVASNAMFMVNLSYANVGRLASQDGWVEVALPSATQFISATDAWGAPLPPDLSDGDLMTWTIPSLRARSPWEHILITVQTDEGLPEGTPLTTTASIASPDEESNLENNEASAVSLIGDMAGSTKQVQARHVMPADLLTYTITISQAHQLGGGTNGRWVLLTDTLPFSHQVRFLGWQGTITGTQIDGHMLRWQGQVQAGEPLTLQYRLGVEGVVTPGTIITNVAWLAWDGRRMQLGPVTTVVTLPYGNLALGPFQGGQLYHQYGVSLTVPPGAISDTTRFQFRPLPTDTVPITPPGSLLFANRAFELNAWRFGEPVREFSRPLTITVHYTDTDVIGLKRETLRLWTRSGPTGPWTVLGEPARVMSRALAFTTTHFSEFALFGEAKYRCHLPVILR